MTKLPIPARPSQRSWLKTMSKVFLKHDAVNSPQDTVISQGEDPEVLGQGHMLWQQLWSDSTWKSFKETQAGPWEWDQLNIQDTYTWETALRGMFVISKETLEDLTLSRTTFPVFSRATDIMLFDFLYSKYLFCNCFMHVSRRQRLLGHSIYTDEVNNARLQLFYKKVIFFIKFSFT